MEHMALLSKDDLRNLSRNFSNMFPKHEVHLDENILRGLDFLLQKLFKIAEEPILSDPHRAAACNTLCGFVEQGISSSNLTLQKRCSNITIWDRILNIYLERSNGAKPKPMRQLLLTLVKSLKHGSSASEGTEVCNDGLVGVFKTKVVCTCLALICSNGDVSRAKSAMQVLEMFLKKNIIDILLVLHEFHSRGCDHNISLELGSYKHLNRSSASSSKTEPQPNCIEKMVDQTLRWIQYPDFGPIIGRLLKAVFGSLHEWDSHFRPTLSLSPALPLWVAPVRQIILDIPELMEGIGYHVLPDLLQLNPVKSTNFVESLPLLDLQQGTPGFLKEADIRLCLLVLDSIEESKMKDLLSETVLGTLYPDGHSTLQDICSTLIVHRSTSIRIAALSALLYSASSTKPLDQNVLNIFRQKIHFFHVEADPKTRGDVVSIIRKHLSRLQNVISHLSKQKADLETIISLSTVDAIKEKNDDENLVIHISSLKWYYAFLLEELRPTASYQRHITALKILQISRQSSVFTEAHTFVDDAYLVRLLLDLIADSFDDVRGIAAMLLRQILSSKSLSLNLPQVDGIPLVLFGKKGYTASNMTQKYLSVALSKVEIMTCRTGRADWADAVGRTYDLMYEHCTNIERLMSGSECTVIILEHLLSALEHDIKIAQGNLRLATSTASMHGNLIALRCIVSRPDVASSIGELTYNEKEWGREWHNRLLDNCGQTWKAVNDILCFDSPEGHVPENPENDRLDVETKDTLSFSWRALKESSLLMHAILINHGYRPPGRDRDLAYEDFLRIGNLELEKLAELRHRGAFSTVSQTFAACCARCLESDDLSTNSLPKHWYQETLSCIQQKAAALTRRSAGLPAMIIGILAALPVGDFFTNVIFDLQAIADAPIESVFNVGEGRMPQVHALNCLKDIFTSTYLGPATEPHINVTLEIAVGCLESDIWAIRNCGLMLLNALLSRLSGGNNSHLASRNSGRSHLSKHVYDKNPNLPDLILRLLGQNVVHPIPNGNPNTPLSATLRSFQVLFPAMEIIKQFGIPPDHEAVVVKILKKQLSSPIWALREKTAEVLSLLTDEQAVIRDIQNTSPHGWRQNELHGQLLCLKSMVLRTNNAETSHYESILPLLTTQFGRLVGSNPCPFTAATYLDIVNHMLLALMNYKKLTIWHDNELFHELRKKWRQTLDSSDEEESLRNKPTDDLLIRALYLLLRFVRPDEDQMQVYCVEEYNFLPYLMRRNHAALPLILAHEEELDLDVRMTEEALKDYILISRYSSDPRIYSKATKQVVASLSLSGCEEGLRNLKPYHSPLADIVNSLDWNHGEASIQIPNMETMNLILQLRGILLAEDGKGISSNELTWNRKFDIWKTMLQFAGCEGSDISTRMAAVSSLQTFQMILRQSGSEPSSSPSFLSIYICLYDILVDDDEEIRDHAALIVSWILSPPEPSDHQPATSSCSFSPPAAKLNLLAFICTSYSHSEELYLEALRRLTSTEELKNSSGPTANYLYSDNPSNERPTLHLEPVESMLSHARKEDNALFVEEKQNLYVDPVAEMEHWANVLAAANAMCPFLATCLQSWVSSGLAVLIETADSEFDGPLGWSSKPSVFTLGMQVILAAQLFVMTGDDEFGTADGRGEIRMLLGRLLEVGRRIGLHGLWLRRIERVIGEVSSMG